MCPGSLNSILVATVQPSSGNGLTRWLDDPSLSKDDLLYEALRSAADNRTPTVASEVLFTDQRAPVETIIDSIVIRYLLEEGPAGLPALQG